MFRVARLRCWAADQQLDTGPHPGAKPVNERSANLRLGEIDTVGGPLGILDGALDKPRKLAIKNRNDVHTRDTGIESHAD
jgi:hypothetical protein